MTEIEHADLLILMATLSMALAGLPLWMAMVPRNRFYGLRIRATRGDDTLWLRANAYGGRQLCLAGVGLTTLHLLMLPLVPEGLRLVLIGVAMVVTLAAVIVRSVAYAERLAADPSIRG